MVSILRVACLGVALAAVWAYFAELAQPEVLISTFFASLIAALFLGSTKKGKGQKKASASEDESSDSDEDFKEIGLDIAEENIIPTGSRRSTKVCPADPNPSTHCAPPPPAGSTFSSHEIRFALSTPPPSARAAREPPGILGASVLQILPQARTLGSLCRVGAAAREVQG